jgi:ubiquitin carboxyl-terminal hydrolase 16/45
MSCLNQFTAPELLTGNNKFGCAVCSKLKRKKQGEKGEQKDKNMFHLFTFMICFYIF